MKISIMIIGLCLQISAPAHAFDENEEIGEAGLEAEAESQIESGIEELNAWALSEDRDDQGKAIFYAKRISKIKNDLTELKERQQNILDGGAKKKNRKEARDILEKLRPLLAQANQAEELVYKEKIPEIQEIIDEAFKKFNDKELVALENLEPVQNEIAAIVSQIIAAYDELRKAVNDSDLLTVELKN
ncbi:MAG: hypothetical protein HY547_01275 [Elusimicrobia bacterium]|nr:hypothetical protein [Elusimicrobiota bacterium]